MKIENGEQPILGLHANFELDRSVHVRTGAENVRVRNHFFKKCTIDQTENGIQLPIVVRKLPKLNNM